MRILLPTERKETIEKKTTDKGKENKIEKHFGKWYYFNDDKVTKLDFLFQLEDMFGDNVNPANGYMLFYRSRILNKENTNGVLVPKIIYNKVPEFWSSKIESENSEFEKLYETEKKERQERENQAKCKKIFIYSEKSIEMVDDVVLKVYIIHIRDYYLLLLSSIKKYQKKKRVNTLRICSRMLIYKTN